MFLLIIKPSVMWRQMHYDSSNCRQQQQKQQQQQLI